MQAYFPNTYVIRCIQFTYIRRHGEPWRQFRSRVQKPVLQLSTVRRYLQPLEAVTNDFLQRCESLLDHNSELPADFDNEIHKWSLECKRHKNICNKFHNKSFMYFSN